MKDIRKLKWKVLRFWEHDIKKSPKKSVGKIINILTK